MVVPREDSDIYSTMGYLEQPLWHPINIMPSIIKCSLIYDNELSYAVDHYCVHRSLTNMPVYLSAMMNCPILLTATPARQSNSPSPLPYPPNQNLVKCLSNICLFVDKYHHKNSPNQNLVTDFPNIFILIFITHLFCPSSSNIWTLWLDESATTTVLSGPTAIPATNQITIENI